MTKVQPFSGKCMNNCDNSSFAYGKSDKKGTALHGYGSLKNVTNAFYFHWNVGKNCTSSADLSKTMERG